MTAKERRKAVAASRDRALGRQYAMAALLRGKAKREERKAKEQKQ